MNRLELVKNIRDALFAEGFQVLRVSGEKSPQRGAHQIICDEVQRAIDEGLVA